MTIDELKRLDVTEKVLNDIIKNGEPFSVKDLAVNGNDIASLGYKGREIGEVLNLLLDKVISNELKNEKAVLLNSISKKD